MVFTVHIKYQQTQKMVLPVRLGLVINIPILSKFTLQYHVSIGEWGNGYVFCFISTYS